jgi:hypothetical protein
MGDTTVTIPAGAIIHRRNAVGHVHSVSHTAWRFYRGIQQSRVECDELQVLVDWHGTESRSSVPLAHVRPVGDEFYVID